jgi:hypothetical protein
MLYGVPLRIRGLRVLDDLENRIYQGYIEEDGTGTLGSQPTAYSNRNRVSPLRWGSLIVGWYDIAWLRREGRDDPSETQR